MEPLSERNVEIKASLGNDEEFEKRVQIAMDLTLSIGVRINQKDVFFNTKKGRFKLRYLEHPYKSELIFYDREDLEGPKLSKYDKVKIEDPEKTEKILSVTNGVLGMVKKQRLLFMYENTRIHLDKVEGLGNYLEFEVCLKEEQTLETGTQIAAELMKIFKIDEKHLIVGAYLDKLINNKV